MEQLTLNAVKAVLLSGGVAYPYPRKGMIGINGGRLQKASKPAITFAQEFYKQRKNND
jgi:hypothetical protein